MKLNSISNSLIIFTLVMVLIAGSISEATAQFLVPRIALSQPASDQADAWLPGYSLGLDYYHHLNSQSALGLRLSFNRWTPDAANLLSVNGRTLEVEKEYGWKTISELSALYARRIAKLPHIGSVWAEASLGVYHLRSPRIELLGNYAVPGAALNHAVIIPESAELVPGASIALSMTVLNRIEPIVRYQHIFAEESTSVIWFGIGLLSN